MTVGFFFGGKFHVQPGAYTSLTIEPSVGTLNGEYTLALIGSANDSEPQTINWQTDPATAMASVAGGPLYTGLQFATQPLLGQNAGPAQVAGLRVDEATQASGQVVNTTPQLDLTSTSWGTPGNYTAYAISAGSVQGYSVSVRNDLSSQPAVTQNNIYRPSFTMIYSGATISGATVSGVTASVSETTVTASGTVNATPVSLFSIPLATYTTIQQVVNQVNVQSGFSATVGTNGSDPSSSLDFVSNVPVVSSGTVFTANEYQVNLYLNSGAQPWLTSALVSGAGAGLPTDGAWHYLSGGTVSGPTTQDWETAFNVLSEDDTVDFIVPITTNATIHAMLAAHCAAMWQDSQPRWGHVGGALGETYDQQLTRAQGLNSPYVSLNWPGIQSDIPTGSNVTYDPEYTACVTAGARAALPLPTDIAGIPLNVLGLEVKTQSSMDALLQGGVAALKNDKTGTYVVMSITSIQNADSDINQQEVSSMIAGLVMQEARAQVQAQCKGIASDALAAMAAEVAQNAASPYYKAGLLLSDPTGFTGTVTASNAIEVQGNLEIGAPANYFGIAFTATTA